MRKLTYVACISDGHYGTIDIEKDIYIKEDTKENRAAARKEFINTLTNSQRDMLESIELLDDVEVAI